MKLGWVIGLTITAILLAVWLLNVISVGVAMCRGSPAPSARTALGAQRSRPSYANSRPCCGSPPWPR